MKYEIGQTVKGRFAGTFEITDTMEMDYDETGIDKTLIYIVKEVAGPGEPDDPVMNGSLYFTEDALLEQ